jgi:hypothetical protein
MAYYEFAVGELTPKRQTLSRFKQAAPARLSITNLSQGWASFQLTGRDETGGCHLEFYPEEGGAGLIGAATFQLGPEETVAIPLLIIPPSPPLLALGKRTYHFTVTATILTGQQSSRSILGQVNHTPLVGPWAILLLTIGVLCLMAWLGVPLAAELWAKPEQSLTSSQEAVATPVTGPGWLDFGAPKPTITPVLAPTPPLTMTYQEMFQEIGAQYDLDWRLLAAVAYRESRLNPTAVGRDGDMGLMQIIPSTWKMWSPKVGALDPFDPYDNTLVGAAYLAYIRDYCRARGHPEQYWMVVGYNWGPDNLGQLFKNNEGWPQVPEKQQHYTLEILETSSNMPAGWAELKVRPATRP